MYRNVSVWEVSALGDVEVSKYATKQAFFLFSSLIFGNPDFGTSTGNVLKVPVLYTKRNGLFVFT